MQREAEVTRMAERQAVFVRGSGRWIDPEAGIAGDFYALIAAAATNGSDAPITDVSLRFEGTFGRSGPAAKETALDNHEFMLPVDEVGPGAAIASNAEITYVCGHSVGDDLGSKVRFTDKYFDDCEVRPDGSMLLRTPRKITEEDVSQYSAVASSLL